MKNKDLIFSFWACGVLASIAFGIAFNIIISTGVGWLIYGICISCLTPLSMLFTRFLKK